MEDDVPVRIVPEDEETLRQEAAFVEAVMGQGVGEALSGAALVLGLLWASADPVEVAGEGVTPSAQVPRRLPRP